MKISRSLLWIAAIIVAFLSCQPQVSCEPTPAEKDVIKAEIEADVPSLHVYVLSRDAAACTYLFKSRYLSTSGDTISNNGYWTFVLKKFESGWKVLRENGTHTLY